MANQDNIFMKIGTSYSSIGGDKSSQGLQEHLNSPQFYKNFFLEQNNDLVTTTNVLNSSIVGENPSNNTNSD